MYPEGVNESGAQIIFYTPQSSRKDLNLLLFNTELYELWDKIKFPFEKDIAKCYASNNAFVDWKKGSKDLS
jgi:hypothetical protein